MFSFHFEKEQKTFQIGDIKVGGQPGENPTVLLASMFHKGDKIVTDRKQSTSRAKKKPQLSLVYPAYVISWRIQEMSLRRILILLPL